MSLKLKRERVTTSGKINRIQSFFIVCGTKGRRSTAIRAANDFQPTKMPVNWNLNIAGQQTKLTGFFAPRSKDGDHSGIDQQVESADQGSKSSAMKAKLRTTTQTMKEMARSYFKSPAGDSPAGIVTDDSDKANVKHSPLAARQLRYHKTILDAQTKAKISAQSRAQQKSTPTPKRASGVCV